MNPKKKLPQDLIKMLFDIREAAKTASPVVNGHRWFCLAICHQPDGTPVIDASGSIEMGTVIRTLRETADKMESTMARPKGQAIN